MKSIVFINPYFGKLPNFFQLWLYSCGRNEHIDWLIFTDDLTDYDYPVNVKVHYLSFQEMIDLLQKCFDFPIVIDNPYKLCDYKPAYGLVFKKWICKYDFWGYCDMDLIFGNIRKFISDDILNNYKKILKHGHFTLIKNDLEGNNLFRLEAVSYSNYKTVFTSSNVFSFDEWGGITPILEANGIQQYYDNVFADVSFCYDFIHLMFIDNDYVPQVFIWDKGRLYRKYFNKGIIYEQEFLYIHLQKRNMKILFDINVDIDKFLIGAHKFFISDDPIDYELLIKISPFKLFYLYWIKRRSIEIAREKINKMKKWFVNILNNCILY